MDKCVEYVDLISAYVDGELAEPDKQRLEKHLAECENCSALFELYREITDSTLESAVEAPESLVGNVMDRVHSDGRIIRDYIAYDSGVDRIDDAAKRRKVMHVISRYMPIAACVVIALLVLPRFFGNGRTDSAPTTGGGSSGSSSQVRTTVPAGVSPGQSSETTQGSSSAGGGAGSGSGSTGGSSATGGASAPAESQDSGLRIFVEDDADNPMPEATPEALPMPSMAPYDDDDESIPAEPGQENPREEMGTDEEKTDQVEEIYAPAPGFGDAMSYLSSAYAWITIQGDLPDFLAGYPAEPFDTWFQWDMFIEIPRDEVQGLLDALSGYDGVDIVYSNESSDYAVVLYSPG